MFGQHGCMGQPDLENLKSHDRRDSLVNAAYEIIAERGMGGLRTRDVASRAGMHHATLHYYFPTKEALIQGVFDRLSDEFLAYFFPPDAPAPSDLPLIEQLRNYFFRGEEQMQSAPARLLVSWELLIYARREPQIMEGIRERNIWQERMMLMLQSGIDRGEIRPDLDAAALAHVLMSFSMGLSMLGCKHPGASAPAAREFLRMLEQYLQLKSQPNG